MKLARITRAIPLSLALAAAPLMTACTASAADKALAGTASPSGTDSTVVIPVEGMTCASCTVAVRTAVKRIEGVKSVEASREQNHAVVVYNASKAKPEQFVDAISKLGYRAGAPVTRQ